MNRFNLTPWNTSFSVGRLVKHMMSLFSLKLNCSSRPVAGPRGADHPRPFLHHHHCPNVVAFEPPAALSSLTLTANESASRIESLSQVSGVLGCQWGDEGKGKLVDILAQHFDIVARCQVSFWLDKHSRSAFSKIRYFGRFKTCYFRKLIAHILLIKIWTFYCVASSVLTCTGISFFFFFWVNFKQEIIAFIVVLMN